MQRSCDLFSYIDVETCGAILRYWKAVQPASHAIKCLSCRCTLKPNVPWQLKGKSWVYSRFSAKLAVDQSKMPFAYVFPLPKITILAAHPFVLTFHVWQTSRSRFFLKGLVLFHLRNLTISKSLKERLFSFCHVLKIYSRLCVGRVSRVQI